MSAMNLLQSIFGANMGGQQQQQGMYQQRMGVPQTFRRKYHAYSPAYWNSENRDKLESGDKIIMPASALEELSRMQITFPIMFEIAHDSDILPKKSHCSVMEFSAPEGSCYLPIWMIDNLGLDPQGDSVIELTTITLAKGSFVQFQAHETAFAMLSNPRVVLEKNLRAYSCLTVGDTIQVEFANHIYKLDVTEVKPCVPRGNAPPAISIIETDINVDFKEPRDYKEWEKKNHGKIFNKKTAKMTGGGTESKNNDDDEEEEDADNFGTISDPKTAIKNDKSSYFESLEESGYSPQKLKKQKSNSPKKNNSKNVLKKVVSIENPYSSRGAPLGKKRGGALGSKAKKKSSTHNSLSSSPSKVRKEEEIVGTMRYIYEVDEHGKRTLIRRLPIRKLPKSSEAKGYSLK